MAGEVRVDSTNQISRQIEKSADLYQPAVYQLLSFYHALDTQSEPLDGNFIPMTSVQARNEQRSQLFAIGLIPPSSSVSARLLDRSASVRALEGGNNADLPSEEFPGSKKDNFLVRPNAGLVEGGSLSSPFGPRQLAGEDVKPHLGCDIVAELGSEVRAATDGIVISITPDGVRTGYGNTIIIKHADGTGSLYAHLSRFGSVSVGAAVRGGTVIGYVGQTSSPNPMPKPHLHFEVLQRIAGGNGHGLEKFNGVIVSKTTPPRLDPIRSGWLSKVGRTVASSKIADAEENYQQTFTGDAEPNAAWSSTGSSNANKASRTSSLVANTSMNKSTLGKKFMAAQSAMINQMIKALETIANTPPLRMLVNPQSFRVSSEKLISDGNWGRSGPIIEHWGDNQDKIEGSGKIAAYYSMDGYNATGPGINRTARQFSTSYQNLLSLWLIYKNNGGVWIDDPIVPVGRAKNLSVVGSVYIYYDSILYIGSFDSFSITESESQPYSVEYQFSFTVRSWFLLDHVDDSQYMYGKPTATPAKPTTNRNVSPLSATREALAFTPNPVTEADLALLQPNSAVPLPPISDADADSILNASFANNNAFPELEG